MSKDFTTIVVAGTAFLAVLAVAGAAAHLSRGNVIETDADGARLALLRIEEWAKWMAGIESAALGGITFLLFKDDGSTIPLSEIQKILVFLAGGFLGVALLCVASIFSSLGSLAIRIHAQPAPREIPHYDITEARMYASERAWIDVRLGAFLTFHHIVWILGLISLGAFVTHRVFC
jgi:hypothetical protein